ncbi:lectin-like domain-containing protein [Weissella confusa]|uniref:lectin-like domain-containing protein n=1 Tax=Weissella confusa TaxID=1583 RepID=UPI00223BA637|nr:hypothetical protein [Weissella confusa]
MMKSKYDNEVPLFKAGSEGTQKKWLVKGIATLAMLGGIAAASDASGVADKVDDMFEAAIHMALEPASAATVANTTIDKATAVPSRSTTSTGKETSDYLVKGSAKYQDTNSNNNYSWYSLSNGKQQTGLVVYNTALDTKNDFTASGSFYVGNYAANAADYNGILLSSILPDTLGSGTGGGGLGIQGIKNAISFGMDMYSNGSTYKDASGTYPMVGIRTTDSSGNLTQASVDSSLTSGSGVSSLPASNKPDGINAGTGAAWSVKYTASTKTLTFSLGGKVTKSMTINTTTMPYLSFALIGSAGDNTTEMTSSIQSVSGTKASMTVPVTYKDTAGNTLLTSTKLDVGDGQSVGINGASPKASSDTFSYDAPVVPGYYIKSANDISVKVGSGTTPSLDLVYEKSPQQATVNRTGLNAANAVKNGTTVPASGVTSGAIAIADASLAVAGYSYVVTAPDGKQYSTMSEALAAGSNGVYDSTTNSSGASDAAVQSFGVSYSALSQKANFTYSGGTPLSGAPTVTSGVTDDALPGSLFVYAPSGYRLDSASTTLASGISMTYATTMRSATITGKFDADTATDQNSTIVLKADKQTATLKQVVNAKTSDVESVTGGTDSKIAFTATDSTLAKTNAETAETNATDQGVAGDSTVVEAQKALDDAVAAADNNTGTTQAIVDATNALDRAVAVASAKAVATNPVSQETAVASAKDNLDKVLADSASTTDQIIAARDALKDAVADALEARNNALNGADTAISNASQSTAALDSDVIAAQKALQEAVDNANADTGTTDAVTKATEALNKAISDAQADQEAARAAAAAAIAAMTPVSNEANILAASKSLQDILDNQNATADQITNATTALTNATATEKDTRSDAVSAADAAITNAQAGDNANDEGVQAAIENLQNVIANATDEKSDSDGNVPLTDDIEAATQALAQAISDAASAREDAVTAAQDAMSDTAPVSLEPDTATAKETLQKVLDDPKATATDIEEAMQDFKEAIDTVREERTAVNDEATTAVTNAQNSDYADEQGVQDAIAALKEAQDNDAKDTGTTAEITDAMTALQDALDAAKSDQQKAIDDAEAVVTSPVSHETEVVNAQKALDDLIASAESGGDVSIADINDAAQALQEAVDAASEQRDTANEAADQAVTAAEATNQADEQSVQDAIQALRDLQDAASQDDENALTADIEAATKAIADAVEQAAAAQDAARDAAGQVETAPVSNEQGVQDAQQALNNVLDDPASTVAEIEAAQQALEDAVKTAQDNRDAANSAADSVIDDAQTGDQAGEPGVQDAIAKLQDLQTKAAADNADALTADIEAATKAVTQAIADAKAAQDVARDAAGQVETAPVSNESGVKDAQSALDKVLNDPSATVEEINDATTALENAVDTANAARDSANSNADTAISNAQGTPQINEPAVQEAVEKLQELQKNAANDSSSALTQDILDAIQELSDTVAEAARDKQEAVLAAENALSQTKPVSNESATAKAISDLQALLADENSTAEAVRDATKALTAATASDTTERNATNTEAADAISAAQSSTVATDESVLTAIQNLKDAQTKAANETVDDAGHAWVSQDIVDAMRALQEAVSVAEQAQDTARDEASALVQDNSQTSPVTNEPAITDAKSALQDVIDDPNATAADLEDAKAAYQDVIDQTKTQRDNTKSSATDAITSAQGSDLSADQGVQDAIKALEDVMNQADADSPDALTSDIQDAMKALQDAQLAAVESRNQAAELADQVKGQTAPVSQEPGVQQAVSDLDTLLNDSTATAAQINDAIKALQDAVAEANDERDAVNQAANEAATSAANSDQSQSQAVQDAITALQQAQADAANDEGTSEAIATATKQLQDAVAQEAANQATERDNAAAAMDATAPVSNETAVATAKNALEAVLDDPKSTAEEISDAVKALTDATTAEKENRDTANTTANETIANVPAEVASEPQVAEAVANLQRLMDEAANDSSGALTKDIAAATEALTKAQDDVVGYREQARDAAADALTKTAPVSHEPATAAAIDALNALVNDPNANYADIKQATEDLLNQVATDTQERDATTTDGNALLDQAAQSDLANDPTVVAAMDTLRNAMTTAATDTSDALTADIKAAMQALQDAMTALVDDAREQAQQAIADAKPVSNEKSVADAIKQLQTVLNDPNATRTAIEQAMTKLQNATESAKESRENANSQAQQAIQAAESSSVSDDPAVQAAMQRLQEIIVAAALDDPDNLTADILAAMQALQSAVAKAEAEQAATVSVTTQTSETPAVVTQALYGTTPIYQSGGYPVIVPGVLPYTGYESGAWVSPVLAQSWPYQATAPRTLAGETNGRRIVDRISQLDDREISRAGLDTAIAHENRWLPLGIFLFSSILLLLIAKRRKQDDK